ncbi:MAG: hypothetical protein G8345_03895 [Magnetococcales bacterium]|nr:hypothetical protein [Magnetococcales bacterium]
MAGIRRAASRESGAKSLQCGHHGCGCGIAGKRAGLASPANITTVKVVTWTNGLPCGSGVTDCNTWDKGRLWVTLAGEVQALCQSWGLQGDALRNRLEQLLGLPMNPPKPKTLFVELEVPRKNLNRPCLAADEGDGSKPKCNYLSTSSSGGWSDLQNFVMQQMATCYIDGGSSPGYPFTRLGYTYDWNDKAGEKGHYGASEFVIDPSTPVKTLGSYSTDEYCRNP